MTDQTQAVVEEAETQVPPAVEDTGAQSQPDELEALLSTYEQQATPKPQTEQTQNTDLAATVRSLQDTVDAIRRSDADRRNTEDLARAINDIKGNSDVKDYVVEGWINAEARTNPRINDIWSNRDSDPQAARKLISSLKSKFAKEQTQKSDPNATEDRAVVAAAVRNASSNRAPEEKPPDFAGLTDGEFRQQVKKEYGFDPGV